jgi:hypothetical protein
MCFPSRLNQRQRPGSDAIANQAEQRTIEQTFVYHSELQVLLCTTCRFCLRPGPQSWTQHLRQQPHGLSRAPLKSLVELFQTYQLQDPSRILAPSPRRPGAAPFALPGLRLLDGFECLACSARLTRNPQARDLHLSKAHQQKLAQHKKTPLWRACKLQTYFAENRLIRYFVITLGPEPSLAEDDVERYLSSKEESFFQ